MGKKEVGVSVMNQSDNDTSERLLLSSRSAPARPIAVPKRGPKKPGSGRRVPRQMGENANAPFTRICQREQHWIEALTFKSQRGKHHRTSKSWGIKQSEARVPC